MSKDKKEKPVEKSGFADRMENNVGIRIIKKGSTPKKAS